MAKIGIFWVYKTIVFGSAEEWCDRPIYQGLIDSHFTHTDHWDGEAARIQRQFPELVGKEYFDIPRGRVLWNSATGKARVYSSNKVVGNSNIRKAISEFFGLDIAQVEWWIDPHYTLDALDLDRLFNE